MLPRERRTGNCTRRESTRAGPGSSSEAMAPIAWARAACQCTMSGRTSRMIRAERLDGARESRAVPRGDQYQIFLVAEELGNRRGPPRDGGYAERHRLEDLVGHDPSRLGARPEDPEPDIGAGEARHRLLVGHSWQEPDAPQSARRHVALHAGENHAPADQRKGCETLPQPSREIRRRIHDRGKSVEWKVAAEVDHVQRADPRP